MAQLAVNELTTFRWSFEKDVEEYQAAGIPAIGVWRHKLADLGDERGSALIAEAGLAVSSLHWAGGFTGNDGRTFADSLDDARQAIRSACTLSAGCLIIHTGARGGHIHKHARRLFQQALDKLLPLAEELGVVLAVEPMRGECGAEFTFFNCLRDTVNLVGSRDSDALRIALDTCHWGREPELPDLLPQLAPLLALVQLGDARQRPRDEDNRCHLGDGRIPLGDLMQRLSACGYDGFYEVELMGEEIADADYRDVLARSMQTAQQWMSLSAR